ncbi:MAG TPA: branched-chain amino acid ABC transporter permease [Candidatus Limnocylindria bacterium]|nr:branched-chain amino acid ABC transporter permease [Candidatus Limnocylindria bacterium]
MSPGAALGFLPTDSFNVVVLIGVFVLISLGLHFTFGLLNVVNLAHGEFLLIGAYTAFQVQEATGNVVLGILLAPVVAGTVGILIERGILRPLYERPLDSLLATFGLAVIIRQVVQLIYSANPRTVQDAIGGSIAVAGFNVPWWRLVVVIATVGLVALVSVILARTSFGLHARATVRNPALAETMGINVGLMRAALFALGSAVAGLAGALLAPINTLDPQFGLLFLVNAFLVVILGGQGSLRGLVIAGALLGGTLSILQFVISTVYAQIIVLVIAILAVRLRPVLAARIAAYRDRRSPAQGPGPGSAGKAVTAGAPRHG